MTGRGCPKGQRQLAATSAHHGRHKLKHVIVVPDYTINMLSDAVIIVRKLTCPAQHEL